MPIGGLLAGAEDEQVIPVGLGFDLGFAVLDSRIFFMDLAADLVVDVLFHILPLLILAEFGGCANKMALPGIRCLAPWAWKQPALAFAPAAPASAAGRSG